MQTGRGGGRDLPALTNAQRRAQDALNLTSRKSQPPFGMSPDSNNYELL